MKRYEFTDYHTVEPDHLAVHDRLLEWSRWVVPRSHGWHVTPMFRQYRSKAWQWEMPAVRTPLNELRALDVERIVSALPGPERMALRWSYVLCGAPGPVARLLGVSKTGLASLVRRGRQMLVNRGIE